MFQVVPFQGISYVGVGSDNEVEPKKQAEEKSRIFL